jgi:hypothetical protein
VGVVYLSDDGVWKISDENEGLCNWTVLRRGPAGFFLVQKPSADVYGYVSLKAAKASVAA